MSCPTNSEHSCSNATSPAYINTRTSFKCDGKCQFSYTLDEVDAVSIVNSNTFLLFSLNEGPNTGVNYNGVRYSLKHLQIFSPSLHEYDRIKTYAESILVAEAPGRGYLYICTPMEVGGSSGPLDSLISLAAERVPTAGNQTTINEKIDGNSLCIDSKFYTYTGTGLGARTSCAPGATFIVYAPPSKLPLLPGNLDKLRKIIGVDCGLPAVNNDSVVVNLDGPGGSVSGGDIYIKCEPTGSSMETKEVSFPELNIFDPSNMGNMWTLLTGMFAMLLMWGLYMVYSRMLAALLGPDSMQPEVPGGDSIEDMP